MSGALDELRFGRSAGGHRALAYALIASATLHAALLAALHGPRIASQSTADPAPLVAFLETMRPAPAVASRPALPVAPREAETRARAPEQRRLSRAAPAPAVRHETAARSRWTASTGAEGAVLDLGDRVAARAAPEAAAAPRTVSAPASDGTGAAQPAPASSVERAAALARYRLALIAEAQRYRDYPRLALDNDWRGKVDVRMAVAANGALASLSVDRGSGHEVLDRQALEMIRKAKPLAPIPAALRGRYFTLDIPVIFELREPSA